MEDRQPEVHHADERKSPGAAAGQKGTLCLRQGWKTRIQNETITSCATVFSKPSSTGSTKTRPWLPMVKKTATGAAPLPSTAVLPKLCLTTVYSTHRFPKAAIVGTAIGYAMCGGRVIAEIMYCDFLGRAGDEVFNQLPKWQAMSGNLIKMPVVLRVSVGSKYGAQHSQDWTSLVAHIPGLKVVFPATPYDAKGLMNAALQGTDPVIFFESQRIYDIGEQFHEGGVPEGYYEIPIGEPDVKRNGKDITILTIGATLYRALEAAKILEEKYGISVEVIDARSLVPFNYELVIESVKKTGKIIVWPAMPANADPT